MKTEKQVERRFVLVMRAARFWRKTAPFWTPERWALEGALIALRWALGRGSWSGWLSAAAFKREARSEAENELFDAETYGRAPRSLDVED